MHKTIRMRSRTEINCYASVCSDITRKHPECADIEEYQIDKC